MHPSTETQSQPRTDAVWQAAGQPCPHRSQSPPSQWLVVCLCGNILEKQEVPVWQWGASVGLLSTSPTSTNWCSVRITNHI